MRRVRRAAIVAFAVVLVGVVALLLRSLDAFGVLTEVKPVACPNASVIHALAGAGDMQFDARTGLLFIAAGDRRGISTAQDGIYVYRSGDPAPRRMAGTSANFHPLGIGLYRGADGSLTLMAINIPAGGNPDVEVFDVIGGAGTIPALRERESIAGGLLVDPFAIVAIDKDRFYVTNAHTTHTPLGRALDDYLLLPRSDVVYFDGSSFRIAANHLLYASGIGRSADGATIYVAERLGRQIDAYVRNPFSGDLTFSTNVPVASGLDNLNVESNGDLLVAGHPRVFALLPYAKNPAKPSPSQIFQIVPDAHGVLRRASLLYSGSEISAADVAVIADGRLLTGSAFDSRILACALPR